MSNHNPDKDNNKVLSEISKLHSFWLECGLNAGSNLSVPVKASKLYQISLKFDPSDLNEDGYEDQNAVKYSQAAEQFCHTDIDIPTPQQSQENLTKNAEDSFQEGDQQKQASFSDRSVKLTNHEDSVERRENKGNADDNSINLTPEKQNRDTFINEDKSIVHKTYLSPQKNQNDINFSVQLLRNYQDEFKYTIDETPDNSCVETDSKEPKESEIRVKNVEENKNKTITECSSTVKSSTKENNENVKEKFKRFNKPYSAKPLRDPRCGELLVEENPFDVTPTSTFSYHAELSTNDQEPNAESISSFSFRLKAPKPPASKWEPKYKPRERRAMSMDESIKIPSPKQNRERWNSERKNSERISYERKNNEHKFPHFFKKEPTQVISHPKRPVRSISKPSLQEDEPYYIKRRREIKLKKYGADNICPICPKKVPEKTSPTPEKTSPKPGKTSPKPENISVKDKIPSPPKPSKTEPVKTTSRSSIPITSLEEYIPQKDTKQENFLHDPIQGILSLFSLCRQNVNKAISAQLSSPLPLPRTEKSYFSDNYYSVRSISPVRSIPPVNSMSSKKRKPGPIVKNSSCPTCPKDYSLQRRPSRYAVYQKPSSHYYTQQWVTEPGEIPSFDLVFRNESFSKMSLASADSNLSLLSYLNDLNYRCPRANSHVHQTRPTKRRSLSRSGRPHDPSKKHLSYRINL